MKARGTASDRSTDWGQHISSVPSPAGEKIWHLTWLQMM